MIAILIIDLVIGTFSTLPFPPASILGISSHTLRLTPFPQNRPDRARQRPRIPIHHLRRRRDTADRLFSPRPRRPDPRPKHSPLTAALRPRPLGVFRQHRLRVLVAARYHHVSVPAVCARDRRHHRLHELELSDRRRHHPVPGYLLGLEGPAPLH